MGGSPGAALFYGSNGGGAAPGRMDKTGSATEAFTEHKDDPGGSPSLPFEEAEYLPTADPTVQLKADRIRSASLRSHLTSRRFVPSIGTLSYHDHRILCGPSRD